jgi:transcriptional regulator with XRE-family HTH domain
MSSEKRTGQIIKSARLKAGLTQVELAKKAGLHANTVARIERGEEKPTFGTAKKLAIALNIDINDIPS